MVIPPPLMLQLVQGEWMHIQIFQYVSVCISMCICSYRDPSFFNQTEMWTLIHFVGLSSRLSLHCFFTAFKDLGSSVSNVKRTYSVYVYCMLMVTKRYLFLCKPCWWFSVKIQLLLQQKSSLLMLVQMEFLWLDLCLYTEVFLWLLKLHLIIYRRIIICTVCNLFPWLLFEYWKERNYLPKEVSIVFPFSSSLSFRGEKKKT